MHEYLEEQAAHRLTWIVIWLIVAACLVEAVRPQSFSQNKADGNREKSSPGFCSIVYRVKRVISLLSEEGRCSLMALGV